MAEREKMGGPGRMEVLDSVAGMNATRLHTTSFFSLSSIQNGGEGRGEEAR